MFLEFIFLDMKSNVAKLRSSDYTGFSKIFQAIRRSVLASNCIEPFGELRTETKWGVARIVTVRVYST